MYRKPRKRDERLLDNRLGAPLQKIGIGYLHRAVERIATEHGERIFAQPYRFESCAWVGARLAEVLPLPGPLKQQLLELDDGTRLTEGPAIVQYIADQVPDKKLAPPYGTMARYRLMSWLTFIGTELHKGVFSPLFNPATPDAYKTMMRERMAGRLAWVNGQLAGRTWLLGDDFSVDPLISRGQLSQPSVDQLYVDQRLLLGAIAGSVPLFLVNGNHEQAALCNLDGDGNSCSAIMCSGQAGAALNKQACSSGVARTNEATPCSQTRGPHGRCRSTCLKL